jgi:hypothetical protein
LALIGLADKDTTFLSNDSLLPLSRAKKTKRRALFLISYQFRELVFNMASVAMESLCEAMSGGSNSFVECALLCHLAFLFIA